MNNQLCKHCANLVIIRPVTIFNIPQVCKCMVQQSVPASNHPHHVALSLRHEDAFEAAAGRGHLSISGAAPEPLAHHRQPSAAPLLLTVANWRWINEETEISPSRQCNVMFVGDGDKLGRLCSNYAFRCTFGRFALF